MIAWFTRNDVAANLLMITIVLAGLNAVWTKIPLEFFPSFESEQITVRVGLRGSSPEEAEMALATRIEEAIKDLRGIEEYRSRSTEGGSSVQIEVADGHDPRELLNDVKSRVDAISTFPSDAEKPNIFLSERLREIISVTVSGAVGEREIRQLGEQVRDDLLRIPGINQVELQGVRDFEVAIEIDQDTLRQFNVSLQDIASAISSSSLDLSAGNVLTEGGDVLIRSKGQAYHQDDFENIVLKTNTDGTLLRLRDIATVDDGFEEKAVRTRFNGRLAATVDVYSLGNQSAIAVAQLVKDYVAARQATLPEGIKLDYWDDKSEGIKKRIYTLTSNALQGGILVILLLSLFLRPAVAFWVFIGIPVSFLGAFFVMPLLGVTLNMISLFAFIVVLGIVVDDAIVTGENVYTHLQKAESGLDAAINGTVEVATPVTFGVLTTVVAFLPLAFIDGHRGAFFAQIPLIVVPVLLFSLIESKFVLPAHLKHIRVGRVGRGNRLQQFQRRFADGFERAILRFYRPLLDRCLQARGATVAIFCGLLLIIVAAVVLGHTRFVFFPRIASESVRVNLSMPNGTPFEITDKHMERILDAALKLQAKYIDERSGESVISTIFAVTGARGGGTHTGFARFQLASPEKRSLDISSLELAREWRKEIGSIPGAEEVSFRAEIGRGGSPIDVQIRSNDMRELERMAAQTKAQLATYTGVFDINDSFADGKPELQIELKPEAHLLGVSRSDVIRQVRQAFFGIEAQRIQRGRDDVRVMVRFPRSERNSLAYLNDMLIRTGPGQRVPLAQIATLTPSMSPTAINRINGYRTINVIADIEKETVNMTALTEDLQGFLDAMISEHPGTSYRLRGEQEEQSKSFYSLLIGLGTVLFTIYCLLAIPFGSYGQPLIVMAVIPFGLIGAALGHWIMGMNLTIMSLMGLLALTGVLVNDSLVLVDYINKVRKRGVSVMEAVLTAGPARFRPVMLTSLTTFFGLMPLLFEKETQAQFLIPMAISLGFGIIFATFITLLLVPVIYSMCVRD